MDSVRLTEHDLIEAILTAQVDSGAADALTVLDMVEQAGLSTGAVRAKLKDLARSGRLEVCKVRRSTIDGRLTWVPAYKLKT